MNTVISFQGNVKLMIMFSHRESPQIRIGRSVLHYPLVVEFATMRRTLKPGAEYLQFRPLMRTTHQQCRIFGFAKAVDTYGVFQFFMLHDEILAEMIPCFEKQRPGSPGPIARSSR